MASSLSPRCTPLKHAYDQCFNSWFEGYLQPTIAKASNPPSESSSLGVSPGSGNPSNGMGQTSQEEARRAYSKRKAEEFEAKCGKVWESYRACLAKAVTERGLDDLLDQARKENPLRDPEPPQTSPVVDEFELTPGR